MAFLPVLKSLISNSFIKWTPRRIPSLIANYDARQPHTLMSDTGGVMEWNNTSELTVTEYHGIKATSLDGSTQYWSRALPTNLLTNGNFETGVNTDGWATGGTVTFNDTELGKTGNYCLKIVSTGGQGIFKNNFLTAGKKYKLTVRYKSTCDLRVGALANSTYYGLFTATSQWNTIVKTITALDTYLLLYANSAGTVWIDDISITEDWKLDLNESYELIKHSMNRDMEQTLGAELNSGTVTIGKKYIVTAGTVEGNAVGTEFLAITNATTLDASNKVREIPNLVTNGTFDSNITGWGTAGSNTISHATNCVRVTSTSDGSPNFLNANSVAGIAGKRYRMTAYIRASKNLSFGLTTSGRAVTTNVTVISNPNFTTDYQKYEYVYTAGGAANFELCCTSPNALPLAGDYLEFDNIHYYEIIDYVPNTTVSGNNHTANLTLADKYAGTGSLLISASGAGRGAELLSNGTFETGVNTDSWTVSGGTWTFNDTETGKIGNYCMKGVSGGTLRIFKSAIFEVGKSYEIKFRYKGTTAVDIRHTATGTILASNPISSEWVEAVCRITATDTTLFLRMSDGQTIYFDNFSVKEVLGEVSLPSANLESCVSGKKYTLEGFARLDPASLVYGSNLVTNGTDWTDSNADGIPNDWSEDAPSDITTIETGSGFTGNWVKHAWGGVSANPILYISTNLLTAGKIYKCKFKYIYNKSGSNSLRLVHATAGQQITTVTSTDVTTPTETTIYFTATYTAKLGFMISGGASGAYFGLDEVELYEATPITLTAQLGTKSVTSSALSIVAGSFTKFVLNFEATASEVSQDLKLYLSGAGNVFVDNVSLTQRFDWLTNIKFKPTRTTITDNVALLYFGSYFQLRLANSSNSIELYENINDVPSVKNSGAIMSTTNYNNVSMLLGNTTLSWFVDGVAKNTFDISDKGKYYHPYLLTIGSTGTIRWLQGLISSLQIIRFENISQSNFDPTTYKIGQAISGGGAEVVLYHDWSNVVADISYDKQALNNLTASGSAGNDVITVMDYNQTKKLIQGTKANRPTLGTKTVQFVSANSDTMTVPVTLGTVKTCIVKFKAVSVNAWKLIDFNGTDLINLRGDGTIEAIGATPELVKIYQNMAEVTVYDTSGYFYAIYQINAGVTASAFKVSPTTFFNGDIPNIAVFSTVLTADEITKVLTYMR